MTTTPETFASAADFGSATGSPKRGPGVGRPRGPRALRASIAGLLLALAAPSATPLPGAPPSPSPAPSHTTAPADVELLDEIPELDLVELMNLSWREGRRLPRRYRDLDGLEVRVQGYMALGTPEGIESFQLTSDSCGCAGQIELTHFVEINMTDDLTSYRPDYLDLTGTMSVGIERDEDGFATSLFRLEIERVE